MIKSQKLLKNAALWWWGEVTPSP